MLLEARHGQHDRDLDARAGRRLPDRRTDYPVTELTTGINVPRLPVHALEQLHVGPVVSSARCPTCPDRTRSSSGSTCRRDRPTPTSMPPAPTRTSSSQRREPVPGDGPHDAVHHARASGGRPWSVRAGHMDGEADDRECRAPLRLSEQQGRGAGDAWRQVDRPAQLRRDDRRPELAGPRATPRRRLRSVRQRQDGAEGDDEPLRARPRPSASRGCSTRSTPRSTTPPGPGPTPTTTSIPQDSELGPLGSTFGQRIVSTTYDPDVVTGFGKRRNNWEVLRKPDARADAACRG